METAERSLRNIFA